jgi:hypothetical protein
MENYYWPGMGESVRKYVRCCVSCQKRKPAHTSQADKGVVAPSRLWQRLHVDLLDFNKRSARGHEHVLTITEALSGYVFLFPLFSKTEEEVAEKLFSVIMEVGAVEEIVSDNGTEFVNKVVKHLCHALNMAKLETTIYHPQTNKVEKVNQRIAECLTYWVNAKQQDWDVGLQVLQFALRTTPHSQLGLTPFFLVYGREAYMPYDINLIAPGKYRNMDLHDWVEKRRIWMAEATSIAQKVYFDRCEAARKDARKSGTRRLRVHIGDWVLLKRPPTPGRSKKLDPKYTGPWQIIAFAGSSGLSFVCRMHGRRIRTCRAHVSLMKPFHFDDFKDTGLSEFPKIPIESADTLGPEDTLDSIIDRRIGANGDWEYLVRSRFSGKPADWLSEDEIAPLVKPSELDTFHALYELRHAHQMKGYAKRPVKSKHTRAAHEARKLYPKGTVVARLVPSAQSAVGVEYQWGEVHSYTSPRWHVRYSNGEWETLTEAQLKRAIRLAQTLFKMNKSPALDLQNAKIREGITEPQSQWTVLPAMPKSFGPQDHVGTQIRVMYSTGWSQGTVLDSSNQRAGTYVVRFSSENEPRLLRLRKDTYCPFSFAPQGSWCIVERSLEGTTTEEAEDQD